MTVLLDANVLIALSITEHVHHDAAHSWVSSLDTRQRLATCPITQGALVRMLIRSGTHSTLAQQMIGAIEMDERFEFWPDSVTYSQVSMVGVMGHRQVTDTYLAALARAKGAKLATFDRGLAAMHLDVALLVPTD